MRSRRYADCSKQNSRRSEAKTPVIPILLLLVSTFVSGQEARLDAAVRGRRVYGTVEYLDSNFAERGVSAFAERGVSASQAVLASLWDGLRAEITFQLRLYRRSSGVFAFLGDRLLRERQVYQVASFDFYENRYKILRDNRITSEYAAETEFMDAFFSLPEIDLGEINTDDGGDYYLLARVRMMPVKIIPPLNIITLFSTDTVFTTPWVEAELKP
jgi:hypothetical protein